jgi:hypothetical protein
MAHADSPIFAFGKAIEEIVRGVLLENQLSFQSSLVGSGRDGVTELRAIHGLLETLQSANAEKAAAAKAENEAVIQAVTDASARAAVHAANALWAARQQRIQWAMSALSEATTVHDYRGLTHLYFECQNISCSQFQYTCGMLLNILKQFMKGSAASVWDGYSPSVLFPIGLEDEDSNRKRAESKKAFHIELVDYIHGLLGERPIISPGQQAGQYVIMLPPL